MTRSWFVVLILLLLELSCTISQEHTTSSLPARALVATEGGHQISGILSSSKSGRPFYSFWGIPYAQPPVGPLRLKDPVASDGWAGVRDGSKKPPVCAQIHFLTILSRNFTFLGAEDCLFLNVFTPKPGHVGNGLPVLVYIHGGGLLSSGTAVHKPHKLLNHDVIYVAMQYRVGMLGFFSTEDSIIPGNFGLKDQTLALQWVQKNIRRFGGDPKKVTLMGQSAGAKSVHFHYFSPYSQGLFSRGIMLSGSLLVPSSMGAAFREVAEFTRRLFGCPVAEGITRGEASQSLLTCLQAVNVEDLVRSIQHHISIGFHPSKIGVRVDYDYLPGEPETLLVQGRHSQVNLISGFVANEGALFAHPLFNDDHQFMQEELNQNFHKYGPDSLELKQVEDDPVHLATQIYRHYTGGTKVNQDKAEEICQMISARHYMMPHLWTSGFHTRNTATSGGRTFLYTFTHRGHYGNYDFYPTTVGKHWVSHADDMHYLTVDKGTYPKEDRQLSRLMTQMVYNFAEKGDPTPDSSLGFVWEPATPDNLHHLNINLQPYMQPQPGKEVQQFWESLPTKQNRLLNPDNVIYFPSDRPHHDGQTESTQDNHNKPHTEF